MDNLLKYIIFIVFICIFITKTEASNGSIKNEDSKGYLTYKHISDC